MMNTSKLCARWMKALLLGIGVALAAPQAPAFPPALPHTFYGMIRDELGNPLASGASITLETATGVKVYGVTSGITEAGVNYRLKVPLDAGLTSEAYKPTALKPQAPFKITIKVGSQSFLPIEMTRDFAHIGEPGKKTLLNLSLGEDANGDGIPDAWQRRINANIDLVRPDDDADGDGLSNMQEYLAGTYAYDPNSGFALKIAGVNNAAPILTFTVITGRTYTILGSSSIADAAAWAPVQFRLATAPADSAPWDAYYAASVTLLRVEVITPEGQPVPSFFKLMLE
jgi:hypothetical protein